jgi:hypothetical protein
LEPNRRAYDQNDRPLLNGKLSGGFLFLNLEEQKKYGRKTRSTAKIA